MKLPAWLERAAPSHLGVFLGKQASPRKSGLFSRHLCRCFPDVFHDPRSWAALDAADRYEAGELDVAKFKDTLRDAEEASVDMQEYADALPHPQLEYTRIRHSAAAARIAQQIATSGFYPHVFAELRNAVLYGLGGGGGPRKNPIARAMRPLFLEHFGDIEQPVTFDSEWKSDTALSLAKHIYAARDFSTMPILADALQDAGCNHADVLNHCRDAEAKHARGCWVVDLVLGKS